MTSPFHHFRMALRLMMRNPMFALVSVATLSIGIGANTAIFSAVDAVLIHPLPYHNSDQLVLVTKNMPMFELQKSDASALDFVDYRDLSRSFSGMAALDLNSVNLTGDQEPIRVFGLRASASLFPLLGVQPIAGRVFRSDEEQPGKNHVAILGAGLWKDRFAGDVLRMVLRHAMRPVVTGIAIGLLLAAAVTRLLSSLLYHVTATDPLTFAAVPSILLLIAIVAALIPARRATRVPPTASLRYE
jgi:hypothetical protein